MRPAARGRVIPFHKELALGTLRGALRQAGVAPEEFIAACQTE